MSFQDAVRTCLTQKYADFNGRARRSEFWFWVLFYVIVAVVAGVIDSILGTRTSSGTGIIGAIAGLALLVPFLAVSSRRLHDTGKTGWLTILWFLPTLVTQIIMIVFWATDSRPDNQYGPNPKGMAGGQYYQQMPPPAAPQQY